MNPFKTPKASVIYALFLFPAGLGMAQGTFQNLDFELANVPAMPGSVSVLDGIPAWTAYYGTSQASQITYNGLSLGNANISILDASFTIFPAPLQGFYSVVLQSGMVPVFMPGPAAIAQTGTIPANTLSVQLLAYELLGASAAQLHVSFGGHDLSLVPLSSGAGATLYGADISAYAGTTGQLEIASLPNADSAYYSFEIDSIVFSPSQIPEPSLISLLVIGAAMTGWRLAIRRR